MSYKICPKCGINWIKESDEICNLCVKASEMKPATRVPVETDFRKIVRGHNYGTNSRKIFEKFCTSLGWDFQKAGEFGRQKPLYAEDADAERRRDVWFIFYANYDAERLDSVVDDGHVINLIKDGGDTIYENVDERIGPSHIADRITFVREKAGYVFYGVYRLIENGTLRVYKRIADQFPIE